MVVLFRSIFKKIENGYHLVLDDEKGDVRSGAGR
jgi:hypothetical protein